MNNLAAATNDELIKELVSRSSFIGVVLNGDFDAEQHYTSNPLLDSFQVSHSRSLKKPQIARILSQIRKQFSC